MQFTKGHKLAIGRPKGSKNKATLRVRQIVEACLDSKSLPGEIMALIKTAQPSKKIDVYLQLMPYCYTKLHTVEVEEDDESTNELKEQIAALKDLIVQSTRP